MPENLNPWLRRLEHRLDDRWFRRMGVCDAYYEGDHTLTFATAKFREAFGSLFGTLADNWMQIVVDATAERLKVQGFRFGKEQSADDDAWDIWQANDLDAESNMLQTEAIKLGEAYWLVEPATGDDPPRITAEHPSQVIVACAPGDRRERLAALKKWRGDDGFAYATLYFPDAIYKYQSVAKLSGAGSRGGKINWKTRDGDPGGENPLGEVPVVPLRNNPSMLLGGRSDITVGAIALQNGINKLLCDMLIGSEYQAFPQRVLLGVEIPKGDDGLPLKAAELQSSQSRLWAFGSKDAKVAEFKAADLDNYTKASQHLVRHLTAQTRTPPHYVLGEIVNASGDALKAAETGLVAKTDDKQPDLGGGHTTTMRLAFKAMGDFKRADVINAETIWKDTESRSQAETVDAAVKLSTIGVPNEILWARIGFSPQEIDRMKSMQEADALLAQVPPVPPTNGARSNGAQPAVPVGH